MLRGAMLANVVVGLSAALVVMAPPGAARAGGGSASCVGAFIDPEACVRHFQCFELKPGVGAYPPDVTVTDRFGQRRIALKVAEQLCAPASKNGGDPSAPLDPEHLTGYPTLRRPVVAARGIVVQNQFGAAVLDTVSLRQLLVPTAKSLSAPPPPLSAPRTDHFTCYRVRPTRGLGVSTRFRAIRGVQVQDQFGSRYVTVVKPQTLCVPADKNGEAPDAPSHAAALLCYRTRSEGPRFTEVGPVFTTDQFGPHLVRPIRTQELCVPSLVNPPAPTTTTTAVPTTTTTRPPTTTTTATQPATTTTTLHCVSRPTDPGCSTSVPALDFTTLPGAGMCGTARDGMGNVIRTLACGGLNIGGGISTVNEAPIPDGATNRFNLTSCVGSSCQLAPTTAATECYDCTNTGCSFGTPLPVENGGVSVCIVNTFAAPVAGTIDLATGATSNLAIQLSSNVTLTGTMYANGPCPVCSTLQNIGGVFVPFPVSGTPCTPAIGVCDHGPRQGLGCTTTNTGGLTNDCPPGDDAVADVVDIGALTLDLTPLSTGTLTEIAADGLFCPGQGAAQVGCFGRTAAAPTPPSGSACRSIEAMGSLSGMLIDDLGAPASLATIFCIPASGSLILNSALNLPGPGETVLPGTMTLRLP